MCCWPWHGQQGTSTAQPRTYCHVLHDPGAARRDCPYMPLATAVAREWLPSPSGRSVCSRDTRTCPPAWSQNVHVCDGQCRLQQQSEALEDLALAHPQSAQPPMVPLAVGLPAPPHRRTSRPAAGTRRHHPEEKYGKCQRRKGTKNGPGRGFLRRKAGGFLCRKGQGRV